MPRSTTSRLRAIPDICRALTHPPWKVSQMLRRALAKSLRPGWLAGEQHEDGVRQLHLRAVALELQCILQLPCIPLTRAFTAVLPPECAAAQHHSSSSSMLSVSRDPLRLMAFIA